MARALVLYVLAALLVATAWLRLESGQAPFGTLAIVIALGLLPMAAVLLGTRWMAIGVTAASVVAAASYVFHVPVSDARPGAGHDFFGPVLSSFKDGFLTFYDTELPFRPDNFPLMHSVVLLAIFASCAAIGIFIGAGRPIGSAIALVFAVGWPTTLVPSGRPISVGLLVLTGVLAMLYLFRAGSRPVRAVPQGIAVALVLAAVAGAASTTDAVAKGAFLSWQRWDPYNRPDDPVSLRYVWNSHYGGIHFPKKKTTVLRIRVAGPQRSLYWRATTLDDYTGEGWQENLDLDPESRQSEIDATGLPAKAQQQKDWVRQDVTVEALRDIHLAGSAQPVRWRAPAAARTQSEHGDIVVLPDAVHRDQRYTVWSWVPRVRPNQLIRAGTNYPESVLRDLELIQGSGRVPKFGTPNRSDLMHVFFNATYEDDVQIQANRPLYDVARRVVGDAPTPYAAALTLEAWFRKSGGFKYDEQPPRAQPFESPLAAFVTRTKRGYCQHFAGAMALMLRDLGIPARVAAGFTSGSYDSGKHEWKVTDHEAHDWVEVYFPGWGWMPFDPTPSRGGLDAPYSSASQALDSRTFSDAKFQQYFGTNSTISDLRRAEQNRPGLEGGIGAGNRRGGSGGAAVVREKGPSIVALAFLVLAVAIAAVMVIKAVRRALRFTSRDPRALATACRRDLVGYLADQGHELAPSSTLSEVGGTLDRYYAVDAGSFVRVVGLARFGPPRQAQESVEQARRELRRLRRALRRQLSTMNRIRGAISLRSLTM
ncbi:MAG TPA: transglutaminaseTgpA domain-containing protein [Gaiellaceae bacterium]